jgi:hypothetical protein
MPTQLEEESGGGEVMTELGKWRGAGWENRAQESEGLRAKSEGAPVTRGVTRQTEVRGESAIMGESEEIM